MRILQVEAVKERLGTLGLAVIADQPDDLAQTIRDGIALRGQLIKAANIQPE